jgi:hypothetical protein
VSATRRDVGVVLRGRRVALGTSSDPEIAQFQRTGIKHPVSALPVTKTPQALAR